VAFNFGTPATGSLNHLLAFRRMQHAGLLPDLLLVEVLPSMLHDTGTPLEAQFLDVERLSSSEYRELQAFGLDDEAQDQKYLASRCNPLGTYRFNIMGRISPSWLPWQLRYDWGRNTDRRGWATPPRQAITGEERAVRFAQVHHEYAATLATLQIGEHPIAALRALTMHCQRENIKIVFVLMPEGESFRSLYPPGTIDRVKTALLHLGQPIIDAREWLSEEDFYDGHHPFRTGAERFTERLVHETQPLLPRD
jgi:hypothetical protein